MTKYTSRTKQTQTGSIIVTILVVMLFLTSLLFSLMVLSKANLARARGRIMMLQAQYAAESGADAVIAFFNSGNTSYSGSGGEVNVLSTTQYRATFSTTVADGSSPKQKIITAVGKVYAPGNATTESYTRTIKVTAERSSSTTASSLLSRNIIDVGSGVKRISGKDIYVNGYIVMNKNTNELVAENITVVGKNTGAANCSIGGSGALLKPATFTTPGQTKTKLTLGYNSCITPPGNTSNTDFDVLPNQTNLTTIQSINIPWSQYMDNSYSNSPGGCSDWTSGSSPRSIPSTGNAKKTHYPDSSSNISTSCGTSGDINLGSSTYTINNNAHIRANFCAASACNPTFINPDAGVVKYLFVEGSVNLASIHTPATSGPIVMVVYGADPASKAGACPYGGSVYLGNGGSNDSYAPSLYILTLNGFCVDGTKFDDPAPHSPDNALPVFGGVGGKNLYIAASPSTPRPLLLDTTFPVDQIPVDLAWRASRYERL